MALEMHPNDAGRESKPSLWIFQGQWVGGLALGVLFFITLFIVLSRIGLEWQYAFVLSAIPLALLSGFVHFFVNGKPASHAIDLLSFYVWTLQSWCYLQKLSDKPPQLWRISEAPLHPREFA